MKKIMISAIKSGEGKTTITCGILAALKKMGLNPSAFKCGPDYIDPLFHKSIIGVRGCNLDSFFVDENMIKQLFTEYSSGSDIAVIEGVMGFYDGVAGNTTVASAHEISEILDVPVILAVDIKGSALTICSVINGVKNFKKNNICGVILNNCSKMMYKMYEKMILEHCELPVFGYVPKNVEYSLESRHLGLVTAGEIENLKQKIDILAETLLETVNFEKILEISQSNKNVNYNVKDIEKITDEKPRLAVAKDRAFCFYYQENLDLIEKLGAEIVEFSPLLDEKLPENIDGLYIGGGYPELYLEQLSQNKTMLYDIKKAILNGVPTFAECGGFMYLMDKIDGIGMAKVLKNESFNIGKLSRFGYITLVANYDNFLCKKGESINAHEFHYFDSVDNGDLFEARKPNSNRSWQAMVSQENLVAGYPHMYFYSNIEFVRNFIKKMLENRGI